ncbi:hypothetical protein CALCODRAFT_514934 [Calocera cornea HHB12733]|uniref:Serine hydrolase domain-containing protein n=1 Tax=Calocera cornea HHB12733 TaxID=1353952 RepID=A0A165J058_9BASI|nr:hypothetical protein CALCODRAFT_514934 [Calocera cornea HHB12733]
MQRRLRVLALHGYGQNAHIFRTQILPICKACEGRVEFVFYDGPVVLHPPDQPSGYTLVDEDGYPLVRHTPVLDREETPRGWCTFNEDRTRYHGVEEAFAFLKPIMERERFDGVIGFSQGAALAAYLCAYLEDPTTHPLFEHRFHPPLKFAILCSGFLPIDPPLPHLLQTPTLHILGRHDTHIGTAESMLLATACARPRVEVHEGGHFVATKATWRRFFREWICAFGPGVRGKPEEVLSPVPVIRMAKELLEEHESEITTTPQIIVSAPAPAIPAVTLTSKWVVWTAGEVM